MNINVKNNLIKNLNHSFRLQKSIWTKWEYWPMSIAILPVVLCYLYYSFRSFNFLFFKKVNPGVPMGGAFGVSKYIMLRDIDPELLPSTVLAKAGTSILSLIKMIDTNRISYPIILKPDIGERGFLVQQILSPTELMDRYTTLPCDMIVQSFIDLKEEYTVSFHHFPHDPSSFAVTSICKKDFMHVTGDGNRTIRELMAITDRYLLQLARFERQHHDLLDYVLKKGEVKLLESVGNHSRGTMFLDARYLITNSLVETYKKIVLRLNGIYFGRFDLKANSEEDFIRGNVKIMELNGVLGEPVHVYDPNYTFIKAYKDLFAQWKIIYRISRVARSNSKDTGFIEGIKALFYYRNYKKQMAAVV